MKTILRTLARYGWLLLVVCGFVYVQTQTQLMIPDITARIINEGIIAQNQSFIYTEGLYMLGVALISALCSVATAYASARIGVGFGRDIRIKLFERVEQLQLTEFDALGTATLITRTLNDVGQLQMVVAMGLGFLLSAPFTLIGGITHALNLNDGLSWILMCAAPLLIALVAVVARVSVPLFTSMQKKLDTLNRVLREGLTGVRVIRAFNRDEKQQQRFGKANVDLSDTAIRANRIMAFMMPVMSLILNATIIAIMWYGTKQIDSGTVPVTQAVGNLVAFIQYVMQIMMSLLMLGMMFVMLPRALASATRVGEVLSTDVSLPDPQNPQSIVKPRGVVRFEDVSFRYKGAERPVLEGISFTAGPGEVTAIIGSTGSGKSTLVNLIPRFYDVENGSLTVDGVDVRQMRKSELRAMIGYVPQQASLMSGTIAENLRVGDPAATDEDVRHAAAVAQADEFVSKMEDGYDAYIAQGGTNVSGGQKQRLTIARALTRKPKVFVFDDNFSALDYKTDAQLRQRLKGETADATVFIVAQRVATIMDADRIIVLENGRIAGMGRHKELLSSCEVYREIVISQLGKGAA